MPIGVYPRKKLLERLFTRVDFEGPPVIEQPDLGRCWLFTGARARGYGYIGVEGGRSKLAHLVSYELCIGNRSAGLDVDHLCHNLDKECVGGHDCIHRSCVNPEHLQLVTRRLNIRRGLARSLAGNLRMKCGRGHVLDASNTISWKHHRWCRTCRDDSRRLRKGSKPRPIGPKSRHWQEVAIA